MPAFSFGGLASGLDTNAIIDGLVQIESIRMGQLNERKLGIKSKIGAIGLVSSKLSALSTAATKLGDEGVRASKITSTNQDFTATSDTTAVAGRFSVVVQQTAVAAKARGAAFTSEFSQAKEGTLSLGVDGANYDITIGPSDSLEDVVANINASDAPVSAAILDDGTSKYLSISRLSTGHQIGQPASSALTISESYTGTVGTELGLSVVTTAKNAKLTVDGLAMERTDNTITGAVPGATLTLTGASNSAEDLVISNDSAGTQKRLQDFVDNFNEVLGLLDSKLNPTPGDDPNYSLAGDSSLRFLRGALGGVITGTVSSLTAVRSLVDIGVASQRDGQLTLDATKLDEAIAKDPDAVNRLFSDTTDGIAKVLADLETAYTDSKTGILSAREDGLDSTLDQIDESILRYQDSIDRYRQRLVNQFAAMEGIVSGLNGVSSFLAQSAGTTGWNFNNQG